MSDTAEVVEADPVSNISWELPSETCIRLLKITTVILATEETKEDSIFYSVQIFELNECPPFIALSYSWSSPVRGDIYSTETDLPAGDQTVQTFYAQLAVDATTAQWVRNDKSQLDIVEHKTTRNGNKNLRDALVQLYRIGLHDCYFWADAVCIDQDNVREKEVQVAMMDDIYTAAQAVVVWLGPVDADFESWQWIHSHFLDALTRWEAAYSLEELQLQKPLDPKFTSELGVTPPGGCWMECWEKYFNFYRRRTWFSRAWIVQEVTLAKNIMVQCGPESISWHRLVALGNLIRALGWQLVLGPDVSRGFGRAMADEIIRLTTVRDQLTAQQVRAQSLAVPTDEGEVAESAIVSRSPNKARKDWFRYFAMLLHDTRVYSASDPRDKIYAILGIAKRGLPLGMSMPIAPDYSETSTARSAYTSAAAVLLKELPHLELLSLVQDKESTRVQGLPSWVPDWACTLTGVPLVHLRDPSCAFNCGLDRMESGEIFRLSKDHLFLRGAKLDYIVATCRPMWDIVKTQNIDDMLALCEHLKSDYMASHSGPGEVLWRTIVANTFNGKPALSTMSESFRAWVSARLATIATPNISEENGGQDTGYRVNVRMDDAKIRTKLGILERLRPHERQEALKADERADKDNSFPTAVGDLPTIEDVLEKCRLIHHFKLLRFVSQHGSVVFDAQDPMPTVEEQVVRVEGQATVFQNAMAPTIPFRRLYRTARGHLGLGPASAEVGDQLWMVSGARVPFILRESEGLNGAFELLGETYVHGFMNGEMAKEIEGYKEVVLH